MHILSESLRSSFPNLRRFFCCYLWVVLGVGVHERVLLLLLAVAPTVPGGGAGGGEVAQTVQHPAAATPTQLVLPRPLARLQVAAQDGVLGIQAGAANSLVWLAKIIKAACQL